MQPQLTHTHDEVIEIVWEILYKEKNIPLLFHDNFKKGQFSIKKMIKTTSYINHLEEQMNLNARGDEWNKILNKRKKFMLENPLYFDCLIFDDEGVIYCGGEAISIYFSQVNKNYLIN